MQVKICSHIFIKYCSTKDMINLSIISYKLITFIKMGEVRKCIERYMYVYF